MTVGLIAQTVRPCGSTRYRCNTSRRLVWRPLYQSLSRVATLKLRHEYRIGGPHGPKAALPQRSLERLVIRPLLDIFLERKKIVKRAFIAVLPVALLFCEPCMQRAVAETSRFNPGALDDMWGWMRQSQDRQTSRWQ